MGRLSNGRLTLIFGCLAALLAGLDNALHAAAPSQNVRRPNVLFLLSDDQRPDTIHALGNGHIDTPNLDRLVRNGTTFTRAVAANPICTPSRAEIMTGVSGFRNGVFDFGGKLNPRLALWAATMRDAGYHTCYVGKWHNDGRPSSRGYAQSRGLFASGGRHRAVEQFDWNGRPVTGYTGWAFQSDDGKLERDKPAGLTPNISEHFADAAIELIQRENDKPFFLHVNFTAPHDPPLMPFGYEDRYDPARIPLPVNFRPEHPFDHGNFGGRDEQLFAWPRTPQETRNELAVYYAVISHMDRQIGRILESLETTGQLDNTVIIFASDHGLAIGSHGLRGKQNMYEHTIGVPMILAGPGIPKDLRTGAQCYLRDLFPTVCELAGIEIPDSVESRSLVPLLNKQADSVYPHVFGYFRDTQRMIRTDRWKLIHYPQINRKQLFDLEADPHELRDLSRDERYAEVVARLHKVLKDWQHQMDDPVLK